MTNHVNEGGGEQLASTFDPKIFEKHITVRRRLTNTGLTPDQFAELVRILNARRPYDSWDYKRQWFFPDLCPGLKDWVL